MSVKITPTYTLLHPITVTLREAGGGEREETFTELALPRVKGKHLRATDGIPESDRMRFLFALLGSLTGHPARVFDELDGEDIEALADRLQGPTAPGQPIGATS